MILSFAGNQPRLGARVFVAPTATLVGDVHLGARCSVWFGAVLRGDDHFIRVGEETNIQDNVVVHEGRGQLPTTIGNRVTVGHSVTLHGCAIGDLCIVGMGATVLDGCAVAERCLIAAGSVLAPGTLFPPGTLIMGAPARVKRDLRPQELDHLSASAAQYVALADRYLNEPWCTPASTGDRG